MCYVPTYKVQKEGGGWLLWRGRGKGRKTRPHTTHSESHLTPTAHYTSTHTYSGRPHHGLQTYLGLGLLVEVGSQGGAGDATARHAHALSLVETAGGEGLQGAPAPAQRHGSAGLLVVACEVEGCGVCV